MTTFEGWCRDNLEVVHDHENHEITARCPRCGRDKLAVNLSKGAFQCWVCHFKGRRKDALVEEVSGVDHSELFEPKKELRDGDMTIKRLSDNIVTSEKRRSFPKAPLPKGFSKTLSKIQSNYLRLRKVPKIHIEMFGIGGVPDDGTMAGRLLAGRIIAPIFDDSGRMIYWTARSVFSSDKVKTLNMPAPHRHEAWGLTATPDCAVKTDVLLGLNLIPPKSVIILVEGPMDALVCGAGFVATMGAGLSAAQASLIVKRNPKEVVVLFDPDDAGQAGAAIVRERLSGLVSVREAVCPRGKDPADLGRVQSFEICRNAGSEQVVHGLGSGVERVFIGGLRGCSKKL
jgi:hypothetical protein